MKQTLKRKERQKGHMTRNDKAQVTIVNKQEKKKTLKSGSLTLASSGG